MRADPIRQRRQFVEPCEVCLKEEVARQLFGARIGEVCYTNVCAIARDAGVAAPVAVEVQPEDRRRTKLPRRATKKAAAKRATKPPLTQRQRPAPVVRVLVCVVPGCGTFEFRGRGRTPKRCPVHATAATKLRRARLAGDGAGEGAVDGVAREAA